MWCGRVSQSLVCEGEEDEGPFAERSSSCCCAELQTGPVCPCQRTSLAIGCARRCLRLPATLRACQGWLCGDVSDVLHLFFWRIIKRGNSGGIYTEEWRDWGRFWSHSNNGCGYYLVYTLFTCFVSLSPSLLGSFIKLFLSRFKDDFSSRFHLIYVLFIHLTLHKFGVDFFFYVLEINLILTQAEFIWFIYEMQ